MNNMSLQVDKDHQRRMETGEFLFITAPRIDDKEEIYGIELGSQIKKFKHILDNMSKMEIYKIFKSYIKDKKIEVQVLKEPLDYTRHVDKLYTEENNLIEICSVENKFPCMDTYYTQNIDALKKDINRYLKSHK